LLILSSLLISWSPSSFSSGDLKPELKKKAGLTTPKSNREAPSGSNLAPGSDDEETDNEADLEELLDPYISEAEQEGEAEKGNETENESEGDNVVAFISNKFEKVLSIAPRRDPLSGIMQGYFVQGEIHDPEDENIFRQRVCVFALLTTGVNVNLVEASRPGLGKTVSFNAHLSKKSARAVDLLGAIGERDSSMVAGLQGVLDLKLRATNEASFRGIPWKVTIELPGDMDLEKNFVDPRSNKHTNDPVFPNCLPSDDPDHESDTFFVACFILVRKPESGVVVRGERDRTSRMAYSTPTRPTRRTSDHDERRPHSGSSHHTGRRTSRSGGRAASQRRPTRQAYQDNEDMDVESYEDSPPVQRSSFQRRPTTVRQPSNNGRNRGNSGRSTRTEEETFHDAQSNRGLSGRGARTSEDLTSSGRNRRGRENSDHLVSPRRRRRLTDGMIEESDEINLSYDTSEDEGDVQTVVHVSSSVDSNEEDLYRYR
jgi:hypothetical protein